MPCHIRNGANGRSRSSLQSPGETGTQESLDAHLASRVASYARPDAYVFVDELPKTSTGKLMKSVLRETYRDWKWD